MRRTDSEKEETAGVMTIPPNLTGDVSNEQHQFFRLTPCREVPPAKIRVENLHYDLTQDDIYVRIAIS